MWRRGCLPRMRGGSNRAPAADESLPVAERHRTHAAKGARHFPGCACDGGCPACRGAGPAPSHASRPAASGGPLDEDLSSLAEARLGVPLGDVRFADSGPVAECPRAGGADAAACGHVLAFPGGLPAADTAAGRFALGHELGQNSRDRVGAAPAPDPEALADAVGRALGGPPQAPGAPGGATHPASEPLDGRPLRFGIFDPITDHIDDSVSHSQRALPGLNLTAARIPALLPGNVARLLQQIADGTRAADIRTQQFVVLLVNSQGQQPLIDHLIRGLRDGAFIAGEIRGTVIDVYGVNEFAHALLVTSGVLSPLGSNEEGASRRLHPPGLFPYGSVRVGRDDIVVGIAAIKGSGASIVKQLFGTTGVRHRSVTTLRVIHTQPGTMSPDLAVHELTHVGQYRVAGAQYMSQALHARLVGQGYDYIHSDGSLAASIAAGRSFLDFNREQQAQICDDCYDTRFASTPCFGASPVDLEHFVQRLCSRRGVTWSPGWP